MQNLVYEIITGLIAFIPALAANPGAVITGGYGLMDFGRNWKDGRRIFGDGKTISGYAGGIFSGTVAGIVTYYILNYYSLLPYRLTLLSLILVPFVLSWGSLTGDLIGSFIKRRLNMKSGQKGNLLDMWPFVIVAFLFSFVITTRFFLAMYGNFVDIVLILVLTPLLHRGVNIMAYRMKWKDVPW
ncbi:MAG: CDP-2,3-bis-(O-geranylgeranyl)-sn-glycerol synthase [Candidatus Thermoplasmatota archaeon]|jgi:CDP-2,3-bis-(O-geranylgeranyl)-sn-glycerol synthase|nr:CDP-2,3-bis-(O-geranylgeranyl)-sn-glycerol synthase [Candidatus Thermoplasmatota archaeon]MCL5791076.1 CDP-2,3-bis-(O-geranylgeranyl)-sn-glycerol synthase [Candidatus Thermoplasmatota archaeon]